MGPFLLSAQQNNTTPYDYSIDTIAERTDWKNVNLEAHQLFIDTTRTWEAYEGYKNWNESNRLDSDYLLPAYDFELIKPIQEYKSKLKFPKKFITLKKFHDSYLLYERCDGESRRYELLDSNLVFWGPLEVQPNPYTEVLEESEEKLILKIAEETTFTFQLIEPSVYKLTYESRDYSHTVYLTTPDKCEDFDIMVNNCPLEKVFEFEPEEVIVE